MFPPAALTGIYSKDYPVVITSKSQSGEIRARHGRAFAIILEMANENLHLPVNHALFIYSEHSGQYCLHLGNMFRHMKKPAAR
ncbi:MAG TPA: hypothetical protein VN112_10460, partial [Ensifer sp.]|nr:hypothetical protein [Ensifer sp.]